MSTTPIDPHRHHYAHCLPFGAQLIGAGTARERTRFRLWAPSCERVQLEVLQGEGDAATVADTRAMEPTGTGWFEIDAECGAGALYRYRLEDGLAVPDPASRFQPQDVHGPSEVIDPRAYRWQHTDWHGRTWEDSVLYELHVGALGGYEGVMRRLPALAELGVTAIELMPLADFSGARNWGYDGVLPYAPDASYGRPEQLKALIDAAHGLGLSVLLDVVYNHFGPDGNYLPRYAASFFRAQTTPWGQAIDFECQEVRDFFVDNALYWLNEYRFDGLRLDAVHAIDNDAWLRDLSELVHAKVEHGRHVHLVLENERNTASLLDGHFTAQWNDDAHNALHVLLTGEAEGYYSAYAQRPVARLARVLGEGFAWQGEASPLHDGAPRGEASGHLPPSRFVMFLQNHDQIGNRAFGERLRVLVDDDDRLRAATALLLLSAQIPLLFMDEENGSRQPFLFFTAYEGELAEAVREGRRREFARFAAFADAGQRARIPDPNREDTFAVSSPPERIDDAGEADDRRAWRHFYQSALAVRSKLISPRLKHARQGGAQILHAADGREADALVARWRLGDGETLSIALNLDREAVPLGEVPAGKLIFETPPRAREALEGQSPPQLPPSACIVWLTGDVSRYASRHDTRRLAQEEPRT